MGEGGWHLKGTVRLIRSRHQRRTICFSEGDRGTADTWIEDVTGARRRDQASIV